MRLKRIRDVSLKWKLVVPFLLLSLASIAAVDYVGLRYQYATIAAQERNLLLGYYNNFLIQMENQGRMMGSLATSISLNQEVAKAFAERERAKLLELMKPTLANLKQSFGIDQLHFHTPVAVSFLRVHKPDRYGDHMSFFRGTIVEAMRKGEVVYGLERGVYGTGCRGVAPVRWQGRIVGTVGVGWNLGDAFLAQLKQRLHIDVALYELNQDGEFVQTAATWKEDHPICMEECVEALSSKEPLIFLGPKNDPHKSVLVGTLTDYSGLAVMVVKIVLDRSAIEKRIVRSGHVMMGVGVLALILATFLVYRISTFFLKPIREVVVLAGEIASGKRHRRLIPTVMDELGLLTLSLNQMINALNESREQLEQYATDLESRVRERTSDLIASEDKYRTLVENVPLVVYRLMPDGTLVFLNQYAEALLGVSVDRVIGRKNWWTEIVLPEDAERVAQETGTCIEDGVPVRMQYRCRNPEGKLIHIEDQAIPHRDHDGKVLFIDGIMVDTTEHYTLQEKIIKTEELKTLHEVSMQLAHEIRNPLMTVGGFARRLLKAIPPEDPNHKSVEIILQEAARLELILKMILSYIQPLDMLMEATDLSTMIRQVIDELSAEAGARNIRMELEEDGTPRLIQVDPKLMREVFQTLFKDALRRMPDEAELEASVEQFPETSHVTIQYPVSSPSALEVDHFFFPFVGTDSGMAPLDLPAVKMIIHKHGGLIEVTKEDNSIIVLTIDIPS